MKLTSGHVLGFCSLIALATACGTPAAPPPAPPAQEAPPAPEGAVIADTWIERFDVDTATLATTGRNPFFILEPGHRIVLKGQEGTVAAEVIITVLADTEVIDGVVTRVVEERESKNGELIEVSRNFFAIDPASKDVYYFGEDVDIFRDGKLVDHHGAWRSGVNGARFGLIMPGTAVVGQMYYQEQAPGEAMDRAAHTSVSEVIETPAGRLENCLRVEETSPLEPGEISVKVYAPGIGMAADGALRLAEHGVAAR